MLVTGAAGAIGAATARRIRERWRDTRLALLDVEAGPLETLARALGDASVHAVDLRAVDELPGVVDDIARELPLDGLVNCAGIMRVRHLATWDWNAADELLAIDLLAPLRLQDLVVRGLVTRGERGTIVNIASIAGKVPLRGCTYYGAAKAGLGMASEIARADLEEHGIRVVTVYPGPVRSALEAGARSAYGGAGGGLFMRFAPVGDPAELAERIVHAVETDEPRVIYPRVYNAGWSATPLASWVALAYGPPPVE